MLRRESSGTEKEQEAKRVLRQKEGAAEAGRVEAPRADRITVAQLAADLKAEYTANGRRSLDRLELSLAHLLLFFGSHPLRDPSPDLAARRLQGGRHPARRRDHEVR